LAINPDITAAEQYSIQAAARSDGPVGRIFEALPIGGWYGLVESQKHQWHLSSNM
jgi:hypothetical protein